MRVLLVMGLLAARAFAADPLVPVVVAAVDIKAGAVVTLEMISQRSAAPALATSSVIKPDSVSYIVNQKVRFPVLAGDLMLWSFFETKVNDDVQAKCATALQAPEHAEAQVARHRDVVRNPAFGGENGDPALRPTGEQMPDAGLTRSPRVFNLPAS